MAGGRNMAVETKEIALQSRGNCDIIDITSEVARHVEKSGTDDGIVTLFIVGSTAGITTIEYEPNLLSDFKEIWERLMPQNIPYQHNKTWGDGNGHSHVRASTLGASLVVPFVNKRLTLGTWQQIIVVDFDNRPRARKIVIQILGE
jgi:secondary thiamine-phosphate synthase enzyme